jgi:phosphatidylglycerol---prolipoprotein diacylglyceryl transferase
LKPLIPWFEAPVLDIPFPGLGVLPLHGFGLLVALGFVFGSRMSMARARRIGLDPEVLNRLVGWLVVGTFIGGHFGYGLMYKPEEYLSNPIEFLKVWQGLSSFGGFVVCVPIAIWFFRREKVAVWPYLDCLAWGMTIGWFFGRMGCFVAHDHPGTETNFWLGVYGICQPERNKMVACHDLGLYEGLWSLTMLGVLSLLDLRPRKPGTLVLTYGLVYGPLRFFMDFFRPEATDRTYAGFTPGQYWAAVLTVVCLVALVARVRSKDAPVGPGLRPSRSTDPPIPPAADPASSM